MEHSNWQLAAYPHWAVVVMFLWFRKPVIARNVPRLTMVSLGDGEGGRLLSPLESLHVTSITRPSPMSVLQATKCQGEKAWSQVPRPSTFTPPACGMQSKTEGVESLGMRLRRPG